MKSLVRRILERAGAEDGDAWMQQCLSLSPSRGTQRALASTDRSMSSVSASGSASRLTSPGPSSPCYIPQLLDAAAAASWGMDRCAINPETSAPIGSLEEEVTSPALAVESEHFPQKLRKSNRLSSAIPDTMPPPGRGSQKRRNSGGHRGGRGKRSGPPPNVRAAHCVFSPQVPAQVAPAAGTGRPRLLAGLGGSDNRTWNTAGTVGDMHPPSTQTALEAQQIPVVCSQMASASGPGNDNLSQLQLLTSLTASLSTIIAGMSPSLPVTQNGSAAAVWASQEEGRSSPGMGGGLSQPLHVSVDIPVNVPETCAREALPCTLSP